VIVPSFSFIDVSEIRISRIWVFLGNLPGPSHRIYIPQVQGGPVFPRALDFLSIASYDSQGYGEGIVTRPRSRTRQPAYNISARIC
jgi:hypothetical protein